MVRQIVWSQRAQNDRKQILIYWKNRNQSSAYSRKLNALFRSTARLISQHPGIGRPTTITGVRVKLIRDYLLFYEVSGDTIVILSIWDNRMDPTSTPFQSP
ncbi:MAG: type II toxin-antitoxin system RelE/ParE family toxin [Flavisolibacter sp.]